MGKSMWQVLQLVPYILENAGIATLRVELSAMAIRTAINKKLCIRRNKYLCIFFLLFILGTMTKASRQLWLS
jgi:hypothetical protein